MCELLQAEVMVIGTREHYRWLRVMVVTLVLLNAVDGVLTIAWIETGHFTEANPLMSHLLSTHPVLFITVKMALVCLGLMLLWRYRDHLLAVFSIFLCFTAYCYVLTAHFNVWSIFRLIS